MNLFEAIESGTGEKASIYKLYNLRNENNINAFVFDIDRSLITKFKNLKMGVDLYHNVIITGKIY